MPSLKAALQLIEEHRPKTPTEFHKIGLKTKFLGHGAFREVLKIVGCPLVVKFPLAESGVSLDYRRGKMHSTNEVKRIDKLNDFKDLKPFLPKVYYHDRDSGVLVMHYYPVFKDSVRQFEDLGRVARVLFKMATGEKMGDIHQGNFNRKGRHGVFIDFGY